MTFEVANTITLKEFLATCMRIFYRKRGTWIITGAGIVSLVLLITGVVTINDDKVIYYLAWYFVALTIITPVATVLVARRNFTSNKALQHERLYIFSDERISYKGEGMEGYLEWQHITKFVRIKHFLLLYMAAKQAIFVKSDNLTAEQIAFIQSKIKRA